MLQFSDSLSNLADKASPIFKIPVVREDLVESNTIDCTSPENKDLPECNISEDFLQVLLVGIIVAIVIYYIIILAALQTTNENLKIFLIVSLFIPFLTPIALFLALLLLVNAI